MKVSRGRIQKAEREYANLKKKTVVITTDRTTWKIIDIKTNRCIAKYRSFLEIENFIRDKNKKRK